MELINKYKHNIILYSTIIASIFINFLIFYHQTESSLFSHKQIISPLIYTTLNCLLFSIPFFFIKKRYGFIFIYLLLLDLLLTSNMVYFHYYKNIIPLTSYFNVSNLNELTGTLINYTHAPDFVYFANTLLLYMFYRFSLKNKLQTLNLKPRVIFIIAIIGINFSIAASSIIVGKARGLLESKFFFKDVDQPAFVSYFGLYPLWIFQAVNYVYLDKEAINSEEKAEIEAFINSNKSNYILNSNQEAKNLIVIYVESLSAWTLRFQAGKATPFLTALSKDSDVIFLPQVLPQSNHGQSSDAQIMINTGLLPLFNSAVVFSHINQKYPSIAEALKQEQAYNSLTIMGNKSSTWNQQGMNFAFDIDKMLSINDLKKDDLLGMGISDKSMFKQAADLLSQKTKQPFYCQIITLSSHDGADFDKRPTNLKFPDNYNSELRNYIKAIEYTDNAIGEFIHDIKQNGLYEKSVIVIVADHAGYKSSDLAKYSPELALKIEQNKATFVPLFILNTNKKFAQQKNQVTGYIDIYPSLLDIMGVEKYPWRGMGKSIFSPDASTIAADKNLTVFGDKTGQKTAEIQNKIKAWQISDLMIRKKFFNSIK